MAGKVRQAVLMVGGKGTRLLPLTENKPKPMLSVADRPCIWYLIRSMARAGIEEVILGCGYKPGMMEALGDGSDLGVRIVYSYEDEPRGTAGAMKIVQNRLDDTFVAANGDVFADLDVAGEIERHIETGAAVTDLLTPVDNPCEYGIAHVDDQLRISEFKDKPRPEEVFSNLINAGVYVVQRDVLDLVPENEFSDFSMHIIPKVIEAGRRVQGFELSGLWMDVGRPHDLLRANLTVAATEFRDGFPGEVVDTEFSGTVYVGHDAVVTGSRMDDTVVLRGSRVSDSALRHTLVMDRCTVDGADIADSILGDGCVIGKGARIRNAVLADGTIVPPGAVVEGDRTV